MALSTITAALYARACFCWYASAHGDALVASTRRSPPRRRRTQHPGIAKDGDLARREIQGPSQHGTAELARLLDGGVARGDPPFPTGKHPRWSLAVRYWIRP